MGSIATESASDIGITTKFIEDALNSQIESFSAKIGSELGDNFTTILYAIEVKLKEKRNGNPNMHLILKLYPNHPARQKFLEDTNLFWRELMAYEVLIPELNKLGKKFYPGWKLAVPTFIQGRSSNINGQVDGQAQPEGESQDSNQLKNFIMMVDVRKTLGFKMADKCKGLNYAHCKLVMVELAKFHAATWAYKTTNALDSLQQKFPFLEEAIFIQEQKPMLGTLATQNFQMMKGFLESTLGSDSRVFQGFLNFENKLFESMLYFIPEKNDSIDEEAIGNMFRLKPKVAKKGEKPDWKLGCHGDMWVNNMLFRYDSVGTPTETMFVDLQLCREASPIVDLAYFMYSSTNTALRKNHLSDLLKLYADTFIKTCKLLNVEPLPGFSFPELSRRFTLGKLFGFMSAILVLPIILIKPEAAVDMDQTKVSGGEGDQMAELFNEIGKKSSKSSTLTQRIEDLVIELFNDGLL